MDCKEAKNLIIARISGDLKPNPKHCRRLEAHLFVCKACAKEYENAKWTLAFIQRHKLEFNRAMQTTADKHDALANSWCAIEAKIDTIETSAKQQTRLYRIAWRASAIAAGLIICLSLWRVLPNHRTAPRQMATTAMPSVKVEQISQNGNVAISDGTGIKTGRSDLKTLVINDRHRIVMNLNTSLSIRPLTKDGRVGCRIDLGLGEILVHVQHNGNPFAVITNHGKAVITGTVFNIKASNNGTTLIVAEGSVQFGRDTEIVEVSSGQLSTITDQSPPTRPASCNVKQLTAWVGASQVRPILAQISSLTDGFDLTNLWSTAMSGPVNLENIHYDTWVSEHREWFRREFPWIFDLKDALAKEGIEVDYPELLIQSGDVWQFVCLDVALARFSIVDPNSLLKAASNYGFDKQWLLENVLAAKTALETPVLLQNNFTGLKAFERWLDFLDETKGLTSPTSIYSFHASKYLLATRGLIWFAVRDGKYDLSDEERTEVLALLQQEVVNACKCQNDVLYPKDESEPSCEGDQEPVDSVSGHIETIKTIERRIAQYEIDK